MYQYKNYFFMLMINFAFFQSMGAMMLPKNFGKDVSSDHYRELAAIVQKEEKRVAQELQKQYKSEWVQAEENQREVGMVNYAQKINQKKKVSAPASDRLKKFFIVSAHDDLRKERSSCRTYSSSRRSSFDSDYSITEGDDFFSSRDENKENKDDVAFSHAAYKNLMERDDIIYCGLFSSLENIKK